MSIQIIWKSSRPRTQSTNSTQGDKSASTQPPSSNLEDGLELHSDLGGAHDHILQISKRQLLIFAIAIASILIVMAIGFYHLGNQTKNTQQDLVNKPLSRSSEQSAPKINALFASYEALTTKNSNPSLQELQYQIAKMKGTIEEMNILKDRYANLAMPGPVRNVLEKSNSYSNSYNNASANNAVINSSTNTQNNVMNGASYSGAALGNTTISNPGFAPIPDKDLSATVKELALMNERLQKTEERWLQELNLLNQMPTGFPIENKAGLSSNYGSRIDPFTHLLSYHSGVDFSAPAGTTIYASGDGKIIQTDFDRGNGQFIVIEHAQGFTSKYAHISRFLIRQGEQVKRGQPIAQVGSTGRSTSSHLHYEIAYKNTPLNPMEALSQKPAQVASGTSESKTK